MSTRSVARWVLWLIKKPLDGTAEQCSCWLRCDRLQRFHDQTAEAAGSSWMAIINKIKYPTSKMNQISDKDRSLCAWQTERVCLKFAWRSLKIRSKFVWSSFEIRLKLFGQAHQWAPFAWLTGSAHHERIHDAPKSVLHCKIVGQKFESYRPRSAEASLSLSSKHDRSLLIWNTLLIFLANIATDKISKN